MRLIPIVTGFKGYIVSLVNPKFVSTGIKTAVFVGSLLFLVNHGLAFVRGEMTSDRWISVILTYIMPYQKKDGSKQYCEVVQSGVNPEELGKKYGIPRYFLIEIKFQ